MSNRTFLLRKVNILLLVALSSCNNTSSETSESIKALEKKIALQQERIEGLEINVREAYRQIYRIDESRAKEKGSASNLNATKLQEIEARLDRDEDAINRVGRIAHSAYNSEANSGR